MGRNRKDDSSVSLTIYRKLLILLARKGIPFTEDPASKKWMQSLFETVHPYDKAIQFSHIRDWCLKYEWITDLSLAPTGMSRYWDFENRRPTKFCRNYHAFPNALNRAICKKEEAMQKLKQAKEASLNRSRNEDMDSESSESSYFEISSIPASTSFHAADKSAVIVVDALAGGSAQTHLPTTPESVPLAHSTPKNSAEDPAQDKRVYNDAFQSLGVFVDACSRLQCTSIKEKACRVFRALTRNHTALVLPNAYEETRIRVQERIKKEMLLNGKRGMTGDDSGIGGMLDDDDSIVRPRFPKIPRKKGQNIVITMDSSSDEEDDDENKDEGKQRKRKDTRQDGQGPGITDTGRTKHAEVSDDISAGRSGKA